MARRRSRAQKGRAPRAVPAPGRNWRLLVLLAAAFAIKAVVLAQLQDQPMIQPEGGVDSAAYVRLAREVLGGNVALGPGLYYLSPLYIYFLAAGIGLTGSFTAVRLAQIALGTAAVWCIFVTAQLWFGRRAAWLAAGLAILTGVFTFYEILILQASLDTFLTAAALACLAFGLVDGAAAAALLAGVLWGLQTLNRPNVLIAALGVAVVIPFATRRIKPAGLLVAGLVLGLAPVVARNAIVSHQFALSSSHGGLNLYIGNNAAATGQYAEVPGVRGNMEGQSEDTRKVAEQAVGRALTDAEVSRYFTGLALDWIRANPGRAAALFGRKLALVFNARHQWLDFSYPYYASDTGSILRFLVVGPWLLVPLGFAGLVLAIARRKVPPTFLAWSAFVPFYAIGVALFFVAERYRLPILVPLCICSGAALDGLLQAFRPASDGRTATSGSTSRAGAGAAIAAAAAGAILTAWPFAINNGRYDERLAISKALMNRHDYGAAAIELQRAHELQPDNTVTEFNLGISLISAGHPGEGIAHLRHAVDAKVPIPGARYALANAMLTTGDRDGAVMLLRTFYPADDETAESCFQVAVLAMNAGAPRVAERYLQRALQLKPGWPDALQLLQQLR